MTWHIGPGHLTSCVNSAPITSYTPIERISGPHWGVWVFEFFALKIAVPAPWTATPFENHEELTNGPTRVAVAAVWGDGFFRPGDGQGYGRIYFDPRPNGARGEGSNAQLEADLGALLQRLTTLPSDVPDPQAPDPGSTLRQLALLAYLLNHCTTGPFAPFQQLKMLRPRVVDISVKYAFPEGPADPQGLTAHDEYALIESRVAGIGGFGLRPYRGAGGSYVRLSNAEPELRNDIYLGDALPLDGATAIQWEDAELFKGIGGMPPGSSPLGEGRLLTPQWTALGGPPLTGRQYS